MTAPYRYIRKVYKAGNSYVICIPQIWIRANKIDKGMHVIVELYPDRVVIIKKK